MLLNPVFSGDPFFNHLTLKEIGDSNSNEDTLDKAITIFKKNGLSPTVFVPEYFQSGHIDELLKKNGFKLIDILITLRYNQSISVLEHEEEIIRINSKDNLLGKWVNVFSRSFNTPRSWNTETQRIIERISALSNYSLYAAVENNEVTGVGARLSRDKVSGLYCLGTNPANRKKGVATSIVRKAIQDTVLDGDTDFCLQTLKSDKLSEFYRKLGFKVAYKKKIYAVI